MRAREALWRASAAALLLAASCELENLPSEDAACPTEREIDATTCCPAWTRATAGACEALAWTPPRTLGPDAELAHDPVCAVDGLGRVHLAWSDGGVVFHAVDAGGPPVVERGADIPGSPRELDLAVSSSGASIVVFRQGGFLGETDSDTAIFTLRRAADGARLDDPEPLSLGDDAYQPRVVIGANDHTFITWNQWTGENYGVAHASLPSPTAPIEAFATKETVLSPPVFFSNAPRPAIAADGSLVVTWYQSTGGSLLTFVSERDGATGELSRPGVDSFLSRPETPVSNQPTFNPTAAIADDGRAAVLWVQDVDATTERRATYLATRNAAGAWTMPSSLEDSLGPRTGRACCGNVAFAPTGELGAVWEQDFVIRVALRDAAGAPVTPDVGQSISTETAQALDVQLVLGPEGTGLVTYRERATKMVPFRVVAHRLRGGAIGPREVLSNEEATRDVFDPRAAIGPTGRAVVSWREGGGAGEGGTIRYVTLDVAPTSPAAGSP